MWRRRYLRRDWTTATVLGCQAGSKGSETHAPSSQPVSRWERSEWTACWFLLRGTERQVLSLDNEPCGALFCKNCTNHCL
jgi:hypothetical protein